MCVCVHAHIHILYLTKQFSGQVLRLLSRVTRQPRHAQAWAGCWGPTSENVSQTQKLSLGLWGYLCLFHRKIYAFRLRFSLKPIHWTMISLWWLNSLLLNIWPIYSIYIEYIPLKHGDVIHSHVKLPVLPGLFANIINLWLGFQLSPAMWGLWHGISHRDPLPPLMTGRYISTRNPM